MYRGMRALVPVALLAGLLVGGSAATAAAPATTDGRRTFTGSIDGADYRVEMPERWNGTLVLYSHGYYPEGVPSFGIALTNRPPDRSESERWLLDHGYALAASDFLGRTGYVFERGLRDQIALLDWFEANVGRPRHTVAAGQSMGAGMAIQLAERYPDRFHGVLTFCGVADLNETFNRGLDVTFAVRTLLAPGEHIDLVKPANPFGSTQALQNAIDRALTSEQGRARLALVAALGGITGWYNAHIPRPTGDDWILGQAQWIKWAYSFGFGPLGRADMEARAGGNMSWNVGIDYRHQLARSGQADEVVRAYRAARLDLRGDLGALAAAPRIAPDPAAVAYAYRVFVPRGTTPAPVLTMKSLGDGGAVPNQERWYASQVRRAGDPGKLRHLWVDRGQHCSFNAADEIVAVQALVERIETGRWPNLSPRRLNEAARALGPGYDLVLSFDTFVDDRPMPPAFTNFTPRQALRPSR